MIALLGLSAGFQAGPMAIKPMMCATKPVTMMAGASLGEEAAKKAWLANNPASYGPGAGKAGAKRSAKRGGAPVRTAAAIVAASKAAWNDKHHSASPAGKVSAMYYRSSAFGDASGAVRGAGGVAQCARANSYRATEDSGARALVGGGRRRRR